MICSHVHFPHPRPCSSMAKSWLASKTVYEVSHYFTPASGVVALPPPASDTTGRFVVKPAAEVTLGAGHGAEVLSARRGQSCYVGEPISLEVAYVEVDIVVTDGQGIVVFGLGPSSTPDDKLPTGDGVFTWSGSGVWNDRGMEHKDADHMLHKVWEEVGVDKRWRGGGGEEGGGGVAACRPRGAVQSQGMGAIWVAPALPLTSHPLRCPMLLPLYVCTHPCTTTCVSEGVAMGGGGWSGMRVG